MDVMIVRRNCLWQVYLVGLVLLLGNFHAFARDAATKTAARPYWVHAGPGWGSMGFSWGVGISGQMGKGLVSIRFVRNEELSFFKDSPKESSWDAGVLYGRIKKSRLWFCSLSGGIGVVGGVRRGEYVDAGNDPSFIGYERLVFLTVGIPIEGQLVWTPLPFLGIGINAFANLNAEKSFIGALLRIQIGKLR